MIKLEAMNLEKSFNRKKVIKNVSLYQEEGEIVGLLGPNGAGKTTTFSMILGLLKVDKGKIFFNNHEITNFPMYLRVQMGIGFLSQETSSFRGLTTEENLLAVLENSEIHPNQWREIIKNLLNELEIWHLRKIKSFALSGGERRRLEIARSLVLSPKFLLLDEPFTGIDPIAILDIQKIIHSLKEKGIGILITDHNVRETLKITDRTYIIKDGTIFKEGNPQVLSTDPEVKKGYLGEKVVVD
ncbi:MAG: LPS export ABC transporter ATP-binding protein [Acidobacteriota bacterium]